MRMMTKKITKILRSLISVPVIAFIALVSMAMPVLAAYEYYIPFTVTSENESYTYVPILVDINNSQLYSQGFINSTGTNTDLQEGGLSDTYMMANDKLGIYWPSLALGASKSLKYYLGYSPAQSGFPLITGSGGSVAINDSAALEPAASAQWDWSGYINTGAGVVDESLVYKSGSFNTYVSSAGNVTSGIVNGFPTVVNANGAQNGASGSQALNLPANIVAGNLLIIVVTAMDGTSITWPAGWDGANTLYNTSNGAYVTNSCAYKIADGEEGASITITLGASKVVSYISYQISGYSGLPVAGVPATGNSSSPNPPSLTPGLSSADGTLWLATCGGGTTGVNAAVTGYPANYSDGATYGSGIGVPSVGVARREYAVAAEDPGTFSLGGSVRWVANTIAIKGATIGTSVSGVCASGDHDIRVTYDGSDLKLYIDDMVTPVDSDAYVGSIPNNSNNWSLLDGDVCPATTYFKYTVGATQQIWYQPIQMISGTTLTDRSGNSNTGTITWGSNPAGITVTMSGMVSYASTTSTASTSDPDIPEVLPLPPADLSMTSSADDVSDLPLYTLFHRAAESAGWADKTMYIVMLMIAATLVGFGALIATGAPLAFAVGFGITGAAFGFGWGILPPWAVVIFLVVFGAGLYAWRRG